MNDLRRKIEDLLCEDAWKRDYPQGGSIYKTYQSTPHHDKELYRKEVAPMVDAILSTRQAGTLIKTTDTILRVEA